MRNRWVVLLASVVTVLVGATSGAYAAGVKVCATDASSLSRAAGEYASANFLRLLRETRSLESARKQHQGKFAIIVDADGVRETDWHEAMELDCVEVDNDTLKIPGIDDTFIRVGHRLSFADTGDYFDLLFSGCFNEVKRGERWCFSTNKIDVQGQFYEARLSLDLNETWLNTPVLISKGEHGFWYFIPAPNGGWNVFEGGWATDGSAEPDWSKPWRVLERSNTQN